MCMMEEQGVKVGAWMPYFLIMHLGLPWILRNLHFQEILTYVRLVTSFVIALMYCCLVWYINNFISCHLCRQLGLDDLYEWWWGCRIRKHGFRSTVGQCFFYWRLFFKNSFSYRQNFHPIWPFFIRLSKFLSNYDDSIQNLDKSVVLLFHWCHTLDKWKFTKKNIVVGASKVQVNTYPKKG
jgi:hypothetical protein